MNFKISSLQEKTIDNILKGCMYFLGAALLFSVIMLCIAINTEAAFKEKCEAAGGVVVSDMCLTKSAIKELP